MSSGIADNTVTQIAERCAAEVVSVIFNELSARGRFKDADDFSAALDKAMEDIRPIVADFIAEAGGGRAASSPMPGYGVAAEPETNGPHCSECGGTTWKDIPGDAAVKCMTCGQECME